MNEPRRYKHNIFERHQKEQVPCKNKDLVRQEVESKLSYKCDILYVLKNLFIKLFLYETLFPSFGRHSIP